jgi:hypothetical protein
VTFPACCNDVGLCVPSEQVPGDQLSQLPQENCDEGSICAPTQLIDGQPDTCLTGGMEARCLPSCMPMVAADADDLQQESCPAHHLCVPCEQPDGGVTGACEIGGDMPGRPHGSDAGTGDPDAGTGDLDAGVD